MIVLDSSVWISSFLTIDVHHFISTGWIEQTTKLGDTYIVPSLFLPEVAGAVRRRTGDGFSGQLALQQIRSNPTVQIVPLDVSLAETAARLAVDLSLRGADAVYVAVAEQTGSPLFTWDNELLARASSVIDVRMPT